MSRHQQAMQKTANESPATRPSNATAALVTLPVSSPAPASIARASALQQICEHFSPSAVVENNFRMLITGCRPGDGASTIAAALALDLSQRLSLRTLLIDANSRRPTLHKTFIRSGVETPELILDGPMQIRSTGWAWLDLATCCFGSTEDERREVLARCDEVSRHYAAVVVDLGVVRLDARMLPLARESDPIFLVVRHGHTRRQELATTTAALQAARRSVAGAILNAVKRPA